MKNYKDVYDNGYKNGIYHGMFYGIIVGIVIGIILTFAYNANAAQVGVFIQGGVNTGYIHGPNEEKIPSFGLGLLVNWNTFKYMETELEATLAYYDIKGTYTSGTPSLHFKSRTIFPIPYMSFKDYTVNWVMGIGVTLFKDTEGIFIDNNHDFMSDSNPYLSYEGGFRLKKNDRHIADIVMEHIEATFHHDRGFNTVMIRIPIWWL